jgi:hypothetical protein
MGIIELYFSDDLMATIKLLVTTRSERRTIGVKVEENYDSIFEVFKEELLRTNGLYFTPLAGGIGSWDELIYVLDQCCDDLSPVSYRIIEAPILQGKSSIPEGGIN